MNSEGGKYERVGIYFIKDRSWSDYYPRIIHDQCMSESSIDYVGGSPRIRKISSLVSPASSQRERKIEFFLSKRFIGVSNSATTPASMTKMRS